MRHRTFMVSLSCLFLIVVCPSVVLLRLRFRDRREVLHIGSDEQANVVRLKNSQDDPRGWLLDPLKAMAKVGLASSGATSCKGAHVGEIRPGFVRANHRHHFCNETFIIWNARALFRVENKNIPGGYAQAVLASHDLAICTAPQGYAHAIVNMDSAVLYFMACQDGMPQAPNSGTDYKVWHDLLR